MKKIKLNRIFKNLNNERGNILIISYLALTVFLGLGAAFMGLVANEARVSERQRLTTVSFHIAEAGIERILYDLRQDFIINPDPHWNDCIINSILVTDPDCALEGVYYDFPYANTSLNGGSYLVEMKNTSTGRTAWARSTGTINDVSHTIEIYVRMVDISPWNNAIFAGAGASGTMINGNVDVRGSVHILGTGLNPGDFAMDLGGTAEIVGNNYNGLDPALESLVPALPTTVVGGETVETLNAELRVKNGLVGLSGSSQVGQPNQSGNGEKEFVDGVFVTDGWGGTQGSASAFSDNGTTNAYDLGDAVSFPSLSDPHPDNTALTVQEYFKTGALVLTSELTNIQPNSSFSYSDGTNSISMDGSGNLTITGQIYVQGNDVGFYKNGGDKTINYTGTGTILAEGNINLTTHLTTTGANSFPNNIIGIMTPNDLNIGTNAGIDLMGVFYGENQVVVDKQTDIMGTVVTNYFNLGTNVPAIFQVPETINFLPPGMIGDSTTWFMVVAWIKS